MIAVVIPSNRPEALARWEREWKSQFEARPDCQVYVVRDERATWEQIKTDLGRAAWIVPIKTDCIRVYGFWQAWRDGADTILTMDDDCYPDADETEPWLHAHETWLQMYPPWDSAWGWVSSIMGVRPRGLPHSGTRPTGLNVGSWSNIPDIAGETQLAGWSWFTPIQGWVPRGAFFPMSGMNLAFRRALTPLMYFGLMGAKLKAPDQSWGVHRFGDIWCGLLAKHICDHLGYAVHTGHPIVRHDRASDPQKNRELERPGEAINEWLWPVVRSIVLTATTPAGCMHEVADALDYRLRGRPEPSPGYWRDWAVALHTWATLFETDSPSPPPPSTA